MEEIKEFQGNNMLHAFSGTEGVFEKIGDPQIDVSEFGNVNAASIIFPCVREHLTNLSTKGGIGLVMLTHLISQEKNRSKNSITSSSYTVIP